MDKLQYEDQTYDLIGAGFEVYNEIGPGFLESVYQECLGLELRAMEIPFKTKPDVSIFYKGNELNQVFIPDFVCYDRIILEIKALSGLADEHMSQVLNYLHATTFDVGLLMNFGSPDELEYKRLML